MHTSFLACPFFVITVGIPAQSIHLVGSGGYAQIATALAIAAPGDILHVQPGSYATFIVAKACTIRALTPGTVSVAGNTASGPVTFSPPSGAPVHVVGVNFGGSLYSPSDKVVVSGGRVTFDQCSFVCAAEVPLAIANANVHLLRCFVAAYHTFGVHTAMTASNSQITAVGSSFLGSPQSLVINYFTSPGIDLTGSRLHASDCVVRSGSFASFASPGLRTAGGDVWISDSTIVGNGTCAIVGGPVRADRCVLQPTLPTCTPPASGGLLGVIQTQPLQHGATFTLGYRTIPNSYAAIFASQQLASLTIPGLHAQTQWLGGSGIVNLGTVLADATGQATASWAIPSAIWLIDQPLWFQGLTGFGLPLQLSPVAGGVIR